MAYTKKSTSKKAFKSYNGKTKEQVQAEMEERVETAKKSVQGAFDKLYQELQGGYSDNFLTFLNYMSNFHTYSANNMILIYLQNPNAKRVASKTTWMRLGASHIKAGEHGMTILCWSPFKATRKNKKTGEDEVITVPNYKAGRTYDVSQMAFKEGKEPPTIFTKMQGNYPELINEVERVIRGHNVTLEYSDATNGAEGYSTLGYIRLRTGMDDVNKLHTLVHELAHELVHDREIRKIISKQTAECEADAISYVVLQHFGIDYTPTVDYIHLYERAATNEKTSLTVSQLSAKRLSESMEIIRKKAHQIICEIEGQEIECENQESEDEAA